MSKGYKFLNTIITIATAIIYFSGMLYHFLSGSYLTLALSLSTFAVGFIFCSALRIIINAPRPYETGHGDNLLGKTTEGKSFPSRHVFSIFCIAMIISAYFLIPGLILFAAGVLLCFLRVKTKVHFVRDVVAGAILGTAIGIIPLIFRIIS